METFDENNNSPTTDIAVSRLLPLKPIYCNIEPPCFFLAIYMSVLPTSCCQSYIALEYIIYINCSHCRPT